MDDLEEILQAHSGHVDSSGAFTIDPARFVQAMEELDRAYPFAYLVKLLQFAFAGQPTRLDVSLSPDELHISFASWRARRGHLEQAVGAQSTPRDRLERRSEHLRHAIALLVARPDLILKVEEKGMRLEVSRGDFHLEPLPPSPFATAATTIELRPCPGEPRRSRPSAGIFNLLAPRISRQWPEWPLVCYYLAASPCPIYCNRSPVTRKPMRAQPPSILGRADSVATVWGVGRYGFGDLPREVPLGRLMPGALNWEKEAGDRSVLFLFRLARGEIGEPPRFWQVVQDGFIIGNFRAPSSLYPLEGWLDGSHLVTDGSFLSAVRSSKWEELVEQADSVAREFLQYCAAEIDTVKPGLSYKLAFKRLRAGLTRWAAS